MTRSPVVPPLAALALLLSGCGGESKLAPFPGPPSAYPYALAMSDCAPWDGSAVSIYLLSTAADSLPAVGPHIRISLWMGLDSLPGRRLTLPEDARLGSLLECRSSESCTAMGAGWVGITEVEGDTTIQGEVGLVTSAGDSVHGGFRARWHGHRMMCG